MKKLIIFDLDGTLLDTLGDLMAGVNYALTQYGFPTHTLEDYRFFVGGGIARLIERALPEEARSEEMVGKLRELFIAHYEQHNIDATRPYDGIPELLDRLQGEGFALAVASNKYNAATRKLASHYFPETNFVAVFGQRHNVPLKPDPMVVRHVMKAARIKNADEVLFVGDSGIDMATAAAAGVDGVGVTWGFRPRAELESFSPAHIVDTPREIYELLKP